MFRWVVVVAPRGDVVRLAECYSEYEDAGSLFQMNRLFGKGDDGSRVTVNGTHIALAWREVPNVWKRDG